MAAEAGRDDEEGLSVDKCPTSTKNLAWKLVQTSAKTGPLQVVLWLLTDACN